MSKLKNILVFAEKVDFLKSLCSGAYGYAEEVSVALLGNKDEANFGSKVYYLGDTAERMAEDYIPTLIELIKSEKPDAVMVGSGTTGRLVAGALSAALGTSAITDVSELFVDGELGAKRMVYGGAAFLTATASSTAVVTVKEGVFECAELPAPAAVVDVEYVAPKHTITVTGRTPKTVGSVNLAAAKTIVCAGRGFAEKADIDMAYELAKKIGAEVGCTRPVTEGEGLMDKSLYIGVSGQMLNPDFYLGIGVSGQVQHMVGVSSAKNILAINKDERAPIFEQCDYGYVGDLKAVLPLLIEKFS